MGGYIPPIIWLNPRHYFEWVYSTSEQKLGKNCSISDEDLFFGLHFEFGEKIVFYLHFFGFHETPKPEQNRGRGSSPPMLKIGQNWGKIANYPPKCSTKIGITAVSLLQNIIFGFVFFFDNNCRNLCYLKYCLLQINFVVLV